MNRVIYALFCLGLACTSGYFYYVQYFKWRSCFNEMGRCFDEDTGVVYSQQSGAVWLLVAVLALAIGLYNAWHLTKR